MAMEARPPLRLFAPAKRYPLRGYRAYRFELSAADCILVVSGMGIERAAAAARALLRAAAPRYLVSFGIAGAVENDVHIGDVIVASQVSLFAQGNLGQGYSLASLSEPARQAVQRALENRGARVYTGTAITTQGPQPTPMQLAGYAHPMLEMETAGIARAAREHGTPLLSIRSISDTPDEPIPMPMEELVDAESNLRFASIARACLRNPAMLPRLIRVARNGKRAAENAAVAIAAILEDPLRILGD
jgi:adenosylhomocysteine nucleosidase